MSIGKKYGRRTIKVKLKKKDGKMVDGRLPITTLQLSMNLALHEFEVKFCIYHNYLPICFRMCNGRRCERLEHTTYHVHTHTHTYSIVIHGFFYLQNIRLLKQLLRILRKLQMVVFYVFHDSILNELQARSVALYQSCPFLIITRC